MSLIELLLGVIPAPYDWRLDPRARPRPEERVNLAVHADEDAIRQIEIKQMFAQSRIDRYHDRKVLFVIVGILLATNVIGVREVIAAFLP